MRRCLIMEHLPDPEQRLRWLPWRTGCLTRYGDLYYAGGLTNELCPVFLNYDFKFTCTWASFDLFVPIGELGDIFDDCTDQNKRWPMLCNWTCKNILGQKWLWMSEISVIFFFCKRISFHFIFVCIWIIVPLYKLTIGVFKRTYNGDNYDGEKAVQSLSLKSYLVFYSFSNSELVRCFFIWHLELIGNFFFLFEPIVGSAACWSFERWNHSAEYKIKYKSKYIYLLESWNSGLSILRSRLIQIEIQLGKYLKIFRLSYFFSNEIYSLQLLITPFFFYKNSV